uniref:Uncharacterized protein n=1 Tax=Anguilla anguilla TaxID=7936 RepID=A0A0E9UZ91_ANGAN
MQTQILIRTWPSIPLSRWVPLLQLHCDITLKLLLTIAVIQTVIQ